MLRAQLLDVVLTEVRDAPVARPSDRLGGHGLGRRDQPHVSARRGRRGRTPARCPSRTSSRVGQTARRARRHRTKRCRKRFGHGTGGGELLSAKRRGKGASSLGTSPPPTVRGRAGTDRVSVSSSGSPGCPGPPRRRTRPSPARGRSRLVNTSMSSSASSARIDGRASSRSPPRTGSSSSRDSRLSNRLALRRGRCGELVEAGRDDGDANLLAERVVHDGAEDDVGVGMGHAGDVVGRRVDLVEREVGGAGDGEQHALGAVDRGLQQRRARWPPSPRRPRGSRRCRARCPSAPTRRPSSRTSRRRSRG